MPSPEHNGCWRTYARGWPIEAGCSRQPESCETQNVVQQPEDYTYAAYFCCSRAIILGLNAGPNVPLSPGEIWLAAPFTPKENAELSRIDCPILYLRLRLQSGWPGWPRMPGGTRRYDRGARRRPNSRAGRLLGAHDDTIRPCAVYQRDRVHRA